MFETNDKIYKKARGILKTLHIIFGVISFISGIVIFIIGCTNGDILILTGLLLSVISPLLLYFSWVCVSCVFSMLMDIKYIRNKLYGVKTDEDWGYFSIAGDAEKLTTEEKIAILDISYAKGDISEEEYKELHQRIKNEK